MKRTGQSSVEYLMLVGISLAIMVPSVFIFYTHQMDNRVENSVLIYRASIAILDGAKDCQSLGPRSWTMVSFFMPSNALSISSTPNEREIIFHTPQGDQVVFTDPGMTLIVDPKIRIVPGTNRLKMSMLPNGTFCLTNLGNECT